MSKKSFFLGVLTGVALMLVVIFIFGLVAQNKVSDDPIEYFEHPVSYENKAETSFQVFEVFGCAALAKEASDEILGDVLYLGNTAVILGEDFYNGQVVTIKNPMRVGSYSYISKGDMPLTVPVIDGEFE